MQAFIGKVHFPYNDTYTTIGVYSTNKKAQEAIDKAIDKHQVETGESSLFRPSNDIDEYAINDGEEGGMTMLLIQSAAKYKDDQLGDWRTICTPTNRRDAENIITAMEKAFPQWKYRCQEIA